MEIRATNPVFVVANLILNIIWYYSACFILKPKLKRRHILYIVIIVYGLFLLGTFRLKEDYSAVRTILVTLYNILLYLLLYRGKWYTKILTYFMFMGLMMAVEIMFLGLLETDRGILDIETPRLIMFYGLYLSLNAAVDYAAVLIIRRFRAKEEGQLSFKEIMLFSLYPLSTVVLFSGMCFIMGRDTGFPEVPFLISVTLTVIISVVALIIVIQRIIAFSDMQARRELLQQELDAQAAYYSGVIKHHEALRRLRHDLKNHTMALDILISEGKKQEAFSYLEDMEKEYRIAETNEVIIP